MCIQKYQKLIFCILLLTSLFLSFNTSAQPIGYNIVVDADRVSIREGPSIDFPRITIVSKGEIFKVCGREGEWLKIVLTNSTEGWIWAQLTKKLSPDATMTYDRNIGKENVEKVGNNNKSQKVLPRINLKVIKQNVNIREQPNTASRIIEIVSQGEYLIYISEKDGWYHCWAKNGKEGWVIDWACELIPFQAEEVKTKKETVIIKKNEISVRAGPDKEYPVVGALSMGREVDVFLKEKGWLYIKGMDNQVEGWITDDTVFDPEKCKDIEAWKEEIFKIINNLCNYYDMKKMDIRVYHNINWFPSIRILNKEDDIKIEQLEDGWRLELLFSLRNISEDTLLPIQMATLPGSLTRPDYLFFLTIIQRLFNNAACKEIEISLRGLLDKKGRSDLEWKIFETFSIKRDKLSGIDLENITPDDFWALLNHK